MARAQNRDPCLQDNALTKGRPLCYVSCHFSCFKDRSSRPTCVFPLFFPKETVALSERGCRGKGVYCFYKTDKAISKGLLFNHTETRLQRKTHPY